MEFLPEKLEAYIEAHTREEDQLLQELNRETYPESPDAQDAIGPFARAGSENAEFMIQPETILEIGTFTGYSGICLAQGLKQSGVLHTIDINQELRSMVTSYFEKAGLSDKIVYHTGNAIEIIPTMDMAFDLVFIDADKENYSNYFDLVIDKVRTGGYIIADNVLWSGKVIEPNPDKDTKAIMDFNDKIQADTRVENVLIPVRDGLMVMRKL